MARPCKTRRGSLRVIVAGLREYDDNNDGETVQDQARLISVMTVR
jgi:hypothetical protein